MRVDCDESFISFELMLNRCGYALLDRETHHIPVQRMACKVAPCLWCALESFL